MAFFGYLVYVLLCLVGVFIIFGILIGLTQKLAIRLVPYKMYQCTCFLGTPIHEIGHAIMCLIFGHKIVEIKLLQLHSPDGTLGYVKHTYNRKNLYQRIGNFFIGIGPIIFGSLILLLMLWLLLPNAFYAYLNVLDTSIDVLSIGSVIEVSKNGMFSFFKSLFSSYHDVRLYIFLFLGLQISTHMSLSTADMKGSLDGLLFITVILTIITCVLYFCFGSIFGTYIKYMGMVGSYALAFLLISFIFCIILLLIGSIFKFFSHLRR